MTKLFSGKYFDSLMAKEPLVGSSFVAKGSFTMLFEKKGRLYRLTREGCGHVLMATESSAGNSGFTEFLKDYGPIAPSDEDEGEFYWLAEVEWLEPLDSSEAQTEELAELLSALGDDEELIFENELPDFIDRCREEISQGSEFEALITNLVVAAEFAIEHGGNADIKVSNVMLRPETGDLVLIDPISGTYFELSSVQKALMAEFERGAV